MCAALLAVALAPCAGFARGQSSTGSQADNPVVLDWTPPSLLPLSSAAAVRSNLTLDRNMLNMAAVLMPDADPQTKQAINHVDGVSVHVLQFGASGIPDEGQVAAVRDAYHLRGWKHVVTSSVVHGVLHDAITDLWVVMDGVNIRGAVVLAETPKSVTLVTIAGNLSPVDLLHLRGHFGIPDFKSDGMDGAKTK